MLAGELLQAKIQNTGIQTADIVKQKHSSINVSYMA